MLVSLAPYISGALMNVQSGKVLQGYNFRAHTAVQCKPGPGFTFIKNKPAVVCVTVATPIMFGVQRCTLFYFFIPHARRELRFGGISTLWLLEVLVQSVAAGVYAPSLKQYKLLIYGSEFVLTLKRYPRGEIWLVLLLRTGTSLSQCTSAIAKFHSHAPSSDSCTGTR